MLITVQPITSWQLSLAQLSPSLFLFVVPNVISLVCFSSHLVVCSVSFQTVYILDNINLLPIIIPLIIVCISNLLNNFIPTLWNFWFVTHYSTEGVLWHKQLVMCDTGTCYNVAHAVTQQFKRKFRQCFRLCITIDNCIFLTKISLRRYVIVGSLPYCKTIGS